MCIEFSSPALPDQRRFGGSAGAEPVPGPTISAALLVEAEMLGIFQVSFCKMMTSVASVEEYPFLKLEI